MPYNLDVFVPDGRNVVADPALATTFSEAFQVAKSLVGDADGFLRIGSLERGESISFLETAIGRRCNPECGVLSATELGRLGQKACWPEPKLIPQDQLWAYWSARKSLDACTSQGLGVWAFRTPA